MQEYQAPKVDDICQQALPAHLWPPVFSDGHNAKHLHRWRQLHIHSSTFKKQFEKTREGRHPAIQDFVTK